MESIRIEESFFNAANGVSEAYAIFSTTAQIDFEEKIEILNEAIDDYMRHPELEGASIVIKRYFLSDSANQIAFVESAETGSHTYALSTIEQAPLDGSKVAILIYIVGNTEAHEGTFSHGALVHHYSGNMWSKGADSEAQTRSILESYEQTLVQRGETIADNCLRTWFFVQNVDVNYAGIVKGRRENFQLNCLNKDTHYIASTGIEGRRASADELVQMEAYDVEGINQDQITYLKALTHLNPTIEYGVTFERATRVEYADRSHVIVSGTASIDNKGEVVHVGNVRKQTERLIENVNALLVEGEAEASDLRMAIVYLRDFSDYKAIQPIIRDAYPSAAMVFVKAPVCRPSWLIEMECVAINEKGNEKFEQL